MKDYDDYTPADWVAQAKADEFDALYEQSRQNAPANNCQRPPHFPPHCGCPA